MSNAAVDIRIPFEIEIETDQLKVLPEVFVGLKMVSANGEVVLHSTELMSAPNPRKPGRFVSTCHVPAYALNAGQYALTVIADMPQVRTVFYVEGILNWSIEPLCPRMGLYPVGAWSGVLGPGLVSWDRRPS